MRFRREFDSKKLYLNANRVTCLSAVQIPFFFFNKFSYTDIYIYINIKTLFPHLKEEKKKKSLIIFVST